MDTIIAIIPNIKPIAFNNFSFSPKQIFSIEHSEYLSKIFINTDTITVINIPDSLKILIIQKN